MIRVVTDSSSQLPETLRERYHVSVVPIVVNVNGREYREGVDLDADGFWDLWASGEPTVSTSQPSPGDFIETYRRLVEAGASEILSVHVGSTFSGTLNSARLAAESVSVPVRLVDTATLSFGISCCVWEAAEAIRGGATVDQAAGAAEQLAPRISSVTILQALDFARTQGRGAPHLPDGVDGVPVIMMAGEESSVLGEGRSVGELAGLMVDAMTGSEDPVRVAVCVADASARPFYEAMEELLDQRPNVVETVRYRVGPSIGAFTGPGTAGGFWYPA